MLDIHKYIEGGAVKREKIAMDIKYRRIGEEELRAIVNNPDIKSDFFGQGYNKKVSQDQWTEVYLDKLSCAVAAECFNPEYLYYLNEVAGYVNGAKGKPIGKLKKLSRKVFLWYQNHKARFWGLAAAAAAVIVLLIWALSK